MISFHKGKSGLSPLLATAGIFFLCGQRGQGWRLLGAGCRYAVANLQRHLWIRGCTRADRANGFNMGDKRMAAHQVLALAINLSDKRSQLARRPNQRP